MKTLTIMVTGEIEFNCNGSSHNALISDTEVPKWAKNAFEQIITQLQNQGRHYVHFEDNGYLLLKHTRRLDIVEDWTDPIPDVFTNLERMQSEYIASIGVVNEN